MRKFFMIFGIGAALLVVVGAAGIAFMAVRGSELDRESRAAATASLYSITARWNPDELSRRGTPQLKSTLKPFEVANLFNAFATGLGALVEIEAPQGTSTISVNAGEGTVTSAQYAYRARFEKGDAIIRIFLLKIDGEWLVHGFNVDSPALLNNLTGRPS